MGKYKGVVSARCINCNCKFAWHMDEKPFLCCEIIGTCDHCLNHRTHNCYDEFQDRKIGRKIFKKPKTEVKNEKRTKRKRN